MQTKGTVYLAKEHADNGQSRGRLRTARLWLLDMDDTLFEASAGMFAAIHRRMEDFIADRLDLPLDEAGRVQHKYWRDLGATYLGLERYEGIAPQEFFDATHRFDLAPFIHGRVLGARLRRAVAQLPGKRVVVTNGPACYADRVVRLLRLENVLDDVVSANDMNRLGRWRCKPDGLLFSEICARMGVRPEHTALVEDSPANLKCAKRLGMQTVWCEGYRKKPPHRIKAHPWADFVVEDLADLGRLLVRSRTMARHAPARLKSVRG